MHYFQDRFEFEIRVPKGLETDNLKNLTKKYVHLTNFSVNKKNPKFVKNNDKNAKRKRLNS